MENIRILCVDDEEEIRCALKAVFTSQGWTGDFARDVEEALTLSDLRRPDIIIMDYHLPKIDGITGTRLFRRRYPEVPILVFTIADDQETADRFLAAGASDFAIKPLRAPDIIARIRLHIRMLDHRQGQEGLFVEKGISTATLGLITDFLCTVEEATVEEISTGTGLAYQTVYRYIQYLQENGTVITSQSYGKVGRPKRRFRLRGGN